MNPIFVLALLATVLSVFAQSYTTVDVYEDCTNTIEGTDTITSTIVETTCPLCTGMSQTQIGLHIHSLENGSCLRAQSFLHAVCCSHLLEFLRLPQWLHEYLRERYYGYQARGNISGLSAGRLRVPC